MSRQPGLHHTKQDPEPMQAIRFLHRAFAQALPSVHSRRLTTLMSCVGSLLQGRRLTLTGLGRSLPGRAYLKHAIKRVDRLLGNHHLRAERPVLLGDVTSVAGLAKTSIDFGRLVSN